MNDLDRADLDELGWRTVPNRPDEPDDGDESSGWWPDRLPFDAEELPTPPADALGDVLAPMAAELARGLEADVSLAALVVLGATNAAVNRHDAVGGGG